MDAWLSLFMVVVYSVVGHTWFVSPNFALIAKSDGLHDKQISPHADHLTVEVGMWAF